MAGGDKIIKISGEWTVKMYPGNFCVTVKAIFVRNVTVNKNNLSGNSILKLLIWKKNLTGSFGNIH